TISILLCLLLKGSILSLIGLAQMKSQLGTTPNIRDIVVGRCYVYNALIDPSLRLDCVKMWRQFEDAVVLQSSCNVTVDYLPIFYTVPQSGPCHRSLFWSKTRKLMHSYAAAVGTFWTLEDTLIGFLFNDLHWCGQHKNPGVSCPMWSTCRNHPMYSLWRQASESFAETACGNVTVLLNGSIVNAFDRNSMLGSVEVNGLRPEKVEYVNIKVAADQQGPYMYRIKTFFHTFLSLIFVGCRFVDAATGVVTCFHRTLTILQCIQDPTEPTCRTYFNSLEQGKCSVSD
uniref:ADP-ribosyl cyclase/cyclic ADP-ribose hydrolase n=1 Tax=Cynoglossus semilaevis TaxID=244447 RepID=A0A3P8WY67_CYNSE